ncbi:MAG: hypothetical protein RMI91_03025 [Gemmatales bacterium]|nr:hypothetical protein [Gemmatales bacterium]MDW7993602.1 hypothetical protein [Gemmatales bacterium]
MRRDKGQTLEVKILDWRSGAFTRERLRNLRTELRLPSGEPLPASFVRHAEDQTVAALAVALEALKELPELAREIDEWGVLAAPEYFGREATWAALQRYSREGASAISPHLIPNHCLHSLAGSLSVLLGCHGPNYGIGGGPRQFAELLLAGLAETAQGLAPGYWLLATVWRQAPPELSASSYDQPVCLALAMAVCSASASYAQWRARLTWRPWLRLHDGDTCTESQLSLDSFVRALHNPQMVVGRPAVQITRWCLPKVGWLELHHETAASQAQLSAGYREVAA